MLAAAGAVWVADATTLREFPPLRCAYARKGQQAIVVISGRNARRVLYGAINVVTGEVVRVVRERCRGEDAAALLTALGARRPPTPGPITSPPEAPPWLVLWDNAPPHHTRLARAAAAAAGCTLAWFPFRSPELNPCEDLWRPLKGTVAANRCYPSVDELVTRAVAWLDDLQPADVRHLAGLTSSKFQWLLT